MCWIVFGVSCVIARTYGPLGAILAIALMVTFLFVYVAAWAQQAPRRARCSKRFRG